MKELGGFLFLAVILGSLCFSIGLLLALPMIWFHIGYISRKLDEVIKAIYNTKGDK